jgi:hypothetical protein
VAIIISPGIRAKLAEKHSVSEDEVRQCFENVEGAFLRDIREKHETDPPSHWFISETNRGRKLKVVFVARKVVAVEGTAGRVDIHIKTAFEPDEVDLRLYERFGFSC